MNDGRLVLVNYRTSHQIRARADRLLGPELADVDGNKEDRRSTWSVFNGPEPEIRVLDAPAAEAEAVGRWLAAGVRALVGSSSPGASGGRSRGAAPSRPG
jgi:hypothetical protein